MDAGRPEAALPGAVTLCPLVRISQQFTLTHPPIHCHSSLTGGQGVAVGSRQPAPSLAVGHEEKIGPYELENSRARELPVL